MLSILVTVGFLCTATAIAEVMEVTQPAIVLANRQGVASLVCKYKNIGNAQEIRVTLLKQTGDQITEICASSYTMEFKTFFVEKVIQCHVTPGQNNVTLTLAGLQANDTGLYICKMERMYPPPYFMNKGNGTHLYVIDPEPCPDTAIYLWVLGATASGFFLYSIIISAILVGKVIKRRRCLTTGVYVKMPSEKLEKKVIPFHITVNCNKEGEKPFPSWDVLDAPEDLIACVSSNKSLNLKSMQAVSYPEGG